MVVAVEGLGRCSVHGGQLLLCALLCHKDKFGGAGSIAGDTRNHRIATRRCHTPDASASLEHSRAATPSTPRAAPHTPHWAALDTHTRTPPCSAQCVSFDCAGAVGGSGGLPRTPLERWTLPLQAQHVQRFAASSLCIRVAEAWGGSCDADGGTRTCWCFVVAGAGGGESGPIHTTMWVPRDHALH